MVYSFETSLLSNKPESTVIDVKSPTTATLMRLRFCPAAVRLDRYGATFEKDSVISRLLHNSARLLSLLLNHVIVDLQMTDDDPVETNLQDSLIPQSLHDMAIRMHYWLLLGNSITTYCKTGVPLAILLLWNFSRPRGGFLEVYTNIKRAMPSCHMSIDQASIISITYAQYASMTYMPSKDLMIVQVTKCA